MPAAGEPGATASDREHEQDLAGCAWLALRIAGCMATLYILMLAAIALVAIVGILLF